MHALWPAALHWARNTRARPPGATGMRYTARILASRGSSDKHAPVSYNRANLVLRSGTGSREFIDEGEAHEVVSNSIIETGVLRAAGWLVCSSALSC